MPWTADDAEKHTKKADTASEKKLWAKVANEHLYKGEGTAVIIANSVINKNQFGGNNG